MIDAKAGIILRFDFPNDGPKLHFFLCELVEPTVVHILQLCSYLYGSPIVREPELPSIIRKRESSQTLEGD